MESTNPFNPQIDHSIARPTRPRDWFEVGARLLGLWFVVTLITTDLRTLVELKLEWFVPQRTPIGAYILRALVDAGVGFYLLFFAPRLGRLLYWEDPRRGVDVSRTTAASKASVDS